MDAELVVGVCEVDLDRPQRTNDTLPSQTFATAKECVDEVLNARIWGGLHYRNSDNVGVQVGDSVADWALARNFQPVP